MQAERISNLEILGTADVAFFLGYSEGYVKKLVQKNFIPHHKAESGKVFFKKKEIEDWATTINCPTEQQMQSQASNFIIGNSK